jgi:hypothetical protein
MPRSARSTAYCVAIAGTRAPVLCRTSLHLHSSDSSVVDLTRRGFFHGQARENSRSRSSQGFGRKLHLKSRASRPASPPSGRCERSGSASRLSPQRSAGARASRRLPRACCHPTLRRASRPLRGRAGFRRQGYQRIRVLATPADLCSIKACNAGLAWSVSGTARARLDLGTSSAMSGNARRIIWLTRTPRLSSVVDSDPCGRSLQAVRPTRFLSTTGQRIAAHIHARETSSQGSLFLIGDNGQDALVSAWQRDLLVVRAKFTYGPV